MTEARDARNGWLGGRAFMATGVLLAIALTWRGFGGERRPRVASFSQPSEERAPARAAVGDPRAAPVARVAAASFPSLSEESPPRAERELDDEAPLLAARDELAMAADDCLQGILHVDATLTSMLSVASCPVEEHPDFEYADRLRVP